MTRCGLAAVALVTFICGAARAAPEAERRVLRAPMTITAPVIDGDLSDAAWERAGRSGGFLRDESGAPAAQPTIVYALNDAEHLYLAFRCAEPRPGDLLASVTRDNASIWGDDCVEFNFDPAGGIGEIYQVRVNSLGAKEVLLRGSGHLELSGVRAAARVGADEYMVELALPFALFGITRAPEVTMRWRVNFERLRTIEGEQGDTWQNTGGQWADPDRYGELVILGGALAVEAAGYERLSVARPSGAFMRLANRGASGRTLEVALEDTTEAPAGLARRAVQLAPRGRARVDLSSPVSTGGRRAYRWTVRDQAGATLYSLEKVTQVAQAIHAAVMYHHRRLVVDVDTEPWGELPPGASVTVELRGPRGPLQTAQAQVASGGRFAHASLAVGDLAPGRYELRAIARDPGGADLGPALTQAVAWPQPFTWPETPDSVRVLNNFVTELLSLEPAAPGRYRFTHPRAGWVFIACEADAPSGGVRVLLDDEEVIAHSQSGTAEAMRLLPLGDHDLTVVCEGEAAARSLVVRAIPELLYCQFQANPHVAEHGPYDWDFLQRYVLPHCTSIIASASDDYLPYMEQWKREGRQWIVGVGVPGLSRDATVTAEEAYDYWAGSMGLQHPLADGVIADEFFGGDSDKYLAWTAALRRIIAEPRFAGKVFYPYCDGMYRGALSREFTQVVMDAGWRVAWERYLREQPTEAEARQMLADTLTREMNEWRAAMPGIERHTIVCLGYLSAPPESLDVLPDVNYQVWMDMQFYHLANDPAFAGTYGVMEYLSSYADEENVRWAARLYRHYCIEGRTSPLSRDAYLLPHLTNGDFAHGLEGWTVEEAEPGAVAAGRMEGLSWLQGRYPQTTDGDTFLGLRRSAQGPNVVSQEIRGLEPGRLYSLRMYSADRGDLSLRQEHALDIGLEGAQVLEDRSFQHVFPNCYSHHLGPYDAEHRAWFNYHWRVFRATGPQALLTISDWAAPGDAGGPVGQELMVNFVQVQPYLER